MACNMLNLRQKFAARHLVSVSQTNLAVVKWGEYHVELNKVGYLGRSSEFHMSEVSQEIEANSPGPAADAPPVLITDKAVEMVKKALVEEGCSGLEYALDFSNEARPGDTIMEVNGLTIYIDMASAQYLAGTEIDYVSGLQGQGFKFNNPNAVRSCGCGHSFSAG